MPSLRILLLEDSPLDAELAGAKLTRAGLDFEMDRVDTREDFVSAVDRGGYDLILADYSLPSFNGLEALEIAREASPDVPFLFVSGGLGEEVAIDSLKKGATDYILKGKLERLAPAVERAVSEAHERAERRRAEAALLDQLRITRTITENATLALFIMDERQHCTFMNPAAEKLTGYTLDEVRERPLHDLIHHSRPDGSPYPLAESPIDRAFPEMKREQGKEVFVHKDGHYYPVAFTASPICDGDSALGTILEVRDVTEEKRALEERERLLREAERARLDAESANRMKDEFLATLSHELRTPLNAILGWARLLKSGKVDEDDRAEGLDTIERNARIQAQLIEDLLDISRIISGNLRLDVQRVELAEVIESALAVIAPAAEAKGVRIHKVIDSLAAPVSGDSARLQQVVWNLLSNAVKFTPKGGRAHILLERVNSHVEISVIDTGQGIQPEFLPHVFDRFRQADGSTTRRHGGLGLGLSIVKQLVEMHGGNVRAKSPGDGQGATFTVSFPIVVLKHEVSEPSLTQARKPEAPDLDYDCEPLKGVRVLVVDDEADARALVRRVLAGCQAEVRLADSVAEALRILEKFRPDVLVSDVGMPGEDGYDLIRQIRASGRSVKQLPAVALTAFARAEDRKRAMLAGFQTHVAKPVDPAELVAVVASLAGRTGR